MVAFNQDAAAALLALDDGDAVALAGTLTPKAWIDREGNPRSSADLVAHALLTPYHVTRKRKAMRQGDKGMDDADLGF